VDRVVGTWLGHDITIGILLIPVFSGLIGWVTNWVAVKMMFLPVTWWGIRLPFKLGVGRYKIPLLGWQGVIPSKAAKMGSIAVDTGLAKLGTITEFYRELGPDVLAAHITESARDDLHDLVTAVIAERHPELWATAPGPVRRLIHRRIDAELPGLMTRVMDEIGGNIEQLVDLKLMVIRHLEADPRLLNQIFLDVGRKEFRIITDSGLWLGMLLGVVPMLVWVVYPAWWTVPVGAALVGYLTNWLALKLIFEPLEPVTIGPLRLHGLFLRRQHEVADAYATIIAYRIITLSNVAHQMLHGPDGDRTRRLIADIVSPAVDEAVGLARPLLQVATAGRFGELRDTVGLEAVTPTVSTLTDERFSKERAAGLQLLLAERMRGLSFPDFAGMPRSAFVQDEWLLILVGALLGFAAGVVQLVSTL